jgi:hypothetical protein
MGNVPAGPPGPPGVAGPAGPAGGTGPQGPPGPAASSSVSYGDNKVICTNINDLCVLSAPCPSGKAPFGVVCGFDGNPSGDFGPIETQFFFDPFGDAGVCIVRAVNGGSFSLRLVMTVACI